MMPIKKKWVRPSVEKKILILNHRKENPLISQNKIAQVVTFSWGQKGCDYLGICDYLGCDYLETLQYLDYIIKFIQGQNGRWHDWASFRFDKWVNGDHVWSRDVLYFLAWDSGGRWIRRQTADRGRMELSFRKFHNTIDVWQK